MSTSEDKLRQLMQEKLGNMESPVNPGLWNGIQSGLNATAGSGGVGSGLVKMAWMKVAGIATGVIAVGAVTVGIFSKDIDAPATTKSDSENLPALSEQIDTHSEETLTPESRPAGSTIYTPINAIDTDGEVSPANDDMTPQTLIEEDAVKEEEQLHSKNEAGDPVKENQNPNIHSDPSNYAIESVSAGFTFVNSPGMGLEYLFIPEYTRASAYRWFVNDQLISDSMSPSYEFDHVGEYQVRLEILDKNGQIITELSQNICIGGAPVWKIDANYFTPNGDGFSDVFDPADQSENIIITGLFVYNNQNHLIFSKTDGDLIWNGSDEYGNPMPDGQYMYRITGVDACDGKVEDKTGTMALRR